jgi:hypothetical protein
MKATHWTAVAVVVLFLFGPVLADEDPFFKKRGINDRVGFFIGGVAARADTTVRIDSDVGLGSTLVLEKIFGVPRQRDYPWFHFYYRFSRKHRIDVTYLKVSAEGTRILLDEEIEVGDFIFEIDAAIGAKDTTRFFDLQYRYAFVNNGKAEAGLTAGLGVVDTDFEIYGGIRDNLGFVRTASERVSETIPLPVAGVYTDFTLTRRLFLSVEGTLLSANYAEYSGNISDTRATLRWYPSKYFGFGAGYTRTRFDIEIERDGGTATIDYLLEGPTVFISFLVPGLK